MLSSYENARPWSLQFKFPFHHLQEVAQLQDFAYFGGLLLPTFPPECLPWKTQECSISGPGLQPMSLPNGYTHLAHTVEVDDRPSSLSSSYIEVFMAEEKYKFQEDLSTSTSVNH